jgi:hypothetical protein
MICDRWHCLYLRRPQYRPLDTCTSNHDLFSVDDDHDNYLDLNDKNAVVHDDDSYYQQCRERIKAIIPRPIECDGLFDKLVYSIESTISKLSAITSLIQRNSKEREKEEDYNPIISQLMETICGMTKLRDFPSTLSYKTIDLPGAVLKLMVTYSREVVLKTKEEDDMYVIETVIQAFIALIDVVDMKKQQQQQQQQCEEGSSAAVNVRFVSFQSRHALLASQYSGIAGGDDNDNNKSGIYCLMETILLYHRHEKPISSSSSSSSSSLSLDEQRAHAEYVTNRKTIVRNLFLAMAHMLSHDEVLDRVSDRDRRYLQETICQHFNGCGVSFLIRTIFSFVEEDAVVFDGDAAECMIEGIVSSSNSALPEASKICERDEVIVQVALYCSHRLGLCRPSS